MRLSLIFLFLQLMGNLDFCFAQNACPNPPSVTHAFITEGTKKNEYKQGDVITFICETGYISGPTIKYACTNEGWFVVRQGKCILKPCELPDDIPNGYYEITRGEDFVFGTEIKYFCNEGYQMISKEHTRTCLLDKWTNRAPVCEPLSCEPPPADEKLTIRGLVENDEPILPGRFLTFSCDDPGTILTGQLRLTCDTNGTWDYPFPSCEEISCKAGAVHPHLHVNGLTPENVTMKVGHELQFRCDEDFTLDGFKEIRCLKSGDWSAPFPTCSDKCKVPDIPSNVLINPLRVAGDKVNKGQKFTFRCRIRSHVVQGNTTVECLTNGGWSDEFPTCGSPVGCKRPPALADGDTKYTTEFSYNHGDRVEYSCQPIYTMDGEPYKTCNNGKWIGNMRCLRPCTVNKQLMNQYNIEFKYKRDDKLYAPHNDRITFRCIRGTTHDDLEVMHQTCIDGVMHLPRCY